MRLDYIRSMPVYGGNKLVYITSGNWETRTASSKQMCIGKTVQFKPKIVFLFYIYFIFEMWTSQNWSCRVVFQKFSFKYLNSLINYNSQNYKRSIFLLSRIWPRIYKYICSNKSIQICFHIVHKLHNGSKLNCHVKNLSTRDYIVK